MFSLISVGGQELPLAEIARLNGLLGGYTLDDVSLYSCEGKDADYDLKLHLEFRKGEERHIYLVGMRGGRVRVIR